MPTPPISKPAREVRVVSEKQALFRAAAEGFVSAADSAVKARGAFHVALSGGSTPKGLFELLASDAALRERVPWQKVRFYWSDERHCPPDHPDSNFRMAQLALLSKVPVAEANVHRIHGEDPDAGNAALEYENEIKKSVGAVGNAVPRFDLIYLGMGPDGHTASLFPGTAALKEKKRLVVSNHVEKLSTDRITFTAPLINAAACVIFLASGEDKAGTLKDVLEGLYVPELLPSQLIRPANGRLLWLVDRAAAAMLKQD